MREVAVRLAFRLLATAVLAFAVGVTAFEVGNSIAQAEGTALLPQCVLDADGRLVCAEDMLSHLSSKLKYDFEDGNPFVETYTEIGRVNDGLCALTTEGEIVCKHYRSVAWNHPSGKAPSGKGYISMGAGFAHVCGVKANGGIVCDTDYGDDRQGHLGSPPIDRYSQVSVTDDYACAITLKGMLVCWGSRKDIYTGAPTTGTYSMVSTTARAACAVSEEGEIVCWGDRVDPWVTTNAPTGPNYISVNVNHYPACAITKRGGIDCWSRDGLVTLADSGFVQAVGTGAGVCAVTTEAALECFGSALPPREDLATPGSVFLPRSKGTSGPSIEERHRSGEFRSFVGARLNGPTGGSVSSAASNGRVTLTANPDDGYRFLRWEGDASGTRNPLTITLPGHVFVTAIFEPITAVAPRHVVTATANPVGGGEVRGLAGGSIESGQEIVLWAKPASGYEFAHWRGDARGANNPLTMTVTGDVSVTAVFEQVEEVQLHHPDCRVIDLGELTNSRSDSGTFQRSDGCRDRINGGHAAVYRFRLPTRTDLTIEQNALGFYPLIYLVDASNTLHAEAEGPRRSSTAQISTSLAPGTYDLVVTTQDDDETGSFSLNIAVGDIEPEPEAGEEPTTDPTTGELRRASLFLNRTFPSQTWQIGQPVNLTLPAATGGSGFFTYSIKYEWNNDQTWSPTGVSFDRNTRRFTGTPSLTLDPNPALRRFTVFLRAEDRLRTGQWDELAFVVNLRPAPTAIPRPTTPETLSARIVARRLQDGRIEFALEPSTGQRILPSSRRLPRNPTIGRWLNTSDVVYEGQTIGRISARRLANGRTEFGFLPASATERLLPRSRTFPSGSSATNWLRSTAIEIPIPAERLDSPESAPTNASLSGTVCRSLGPIANGIAFPERSVKLHGASSTLYRVRGDGTASGAVTYTVCVDEGSLSDAIRDQVIFTAGYYASTRPSDDQGLLILSKGFSLAIGAYDAYHEHYNDLGYAAAVRDGLTFMNFVLIANSAVSIADTASTLSSTLSKPALQEVAQQLIDDAVALGLDLTLDLSQEVLEALGEDPLDTVKMLAWDYVEGSRNRGELWYRETPRLWSSSETLVYDTAVLHFLWEKPIARGVAGNVLYWVLDEERAAAWRSALSATPLAGSFARIYFAAQEALAGINYGPYSRLSEDIASADKTIDVRQRALLTRLGLTRSVIVSSDHGNSS